MFRKNADACDEWSPENVTLCAERQAEILECAASMLRPGGRMVYSTCTFAPEENEGTISQFLAKHPEFEIADVMHYPQMSSGVAAWTTDPQLGLERTIRLFPHHVDGEGHYLAVLMKAGSVSENYEGYCAKGLEKGIPEHDAKEYLDFAKETLRNKPEGRLIRFGEQLYLAPENMPSTKGLKVLRPGLHLGTMKKNRFEPSHALALALRPEDVLHSHDMTGNSQDVRAYLNGQTLQADGEKGWYLMTVDGYSIGWGKLAGGMIKNHYPKGLRIPL